MYQIPFQNPPNPRDPAIFPSSFLGWAWAAWVHDIFCVYCIQHFTGSQHRWCCRLRPPLHPLSTLLLFSLSLVSYYFALTSIEWFPADSVWHIEKVFSPRFGISPSPSPTPVGHLYRSVYHSHEAATQSHQSQHRFLAWCVSSVFHMRWLATPPARSQQAILHTYDDDDDVDITRHDSFRILRFEINNKNRRARGSDALHTIKKQCTVEVIKWVPMNRGAS